MIGVSDTIKNEAKRQKGGFLGMILGTLTATLLGNLSIGKGAIVKSQRREANMPGRGTITAGEGTFRAGECAVTTDQNF